MSADIIQTVLGVILVASSIAMLVVEKPVHASLYFLLTLLTLAALYLQLSAEFIAVMQVLVYAGAILVLFIFVVVLFQDAHEQINKNEPKSSKVLMVVASSAFLVALFWLADSTTHLFSKAQALPKDYGTVESLGKDLYVHFFFPFEAVILLFLIAIVGALYIGKKEVSHGNH